MNINHRPIFDTARVEKFYSEKDGVPVRYVCTSALGDEAQAMDIFYRETPHPEFGNRYFGMFYADRYSTWEEIRICKADKIEKAEFGMVEVDGQLHYSSHRHDYHSIGPVSIDGGRAYFKRAGDLTIPAQWFVVKDGEFVNALTAES